MAGKVRGDELTRRPGDLEELRRPPGWLYADVVLPKLLLVDCGRPPSPPPACWWLGTVNPSAAISSGASISFVPLTGSADREALKALLQDVRPSLLFAQPPTLSLSRPGTIWRSRHPSSRWALSSVLDLR